MIDEKRDEVQNLAVEAFLKLKDLNGTANIATGTKVKSKGNGIRSITSGPHK